jgi:hypothetical protein
MSVKGESLLPVLDRYLYISTSGRNSVFGIATCYAVEGSGFEPRCRPDFSHPSGTTRSPTQRAAQRVQGLFPMGKEVGALS